MKNKKILHKGTSLLNFFHLKFEAQNFPCKLFRRDNVLSSAMAIYFQRKRRLKLVSTQRATDHTHCSNSHRYQIWCENPTTQSPATRADYLRSAELAKATDTMQDRNFTSKNTTLFKPQPTRYVEVSVSLVETLLLHCWALRVKRTCTKACKTNWYSSTQKHIQPHHLQSPKTCRSCKSMMSSF